MIDFKCVHELIYFRRKITTASLVGGNTFRKYRGTFRNNYMEFISARKPEGVKPVFL